MQKRVTELHGFRSDKLNKHIELAKDRIQYKVIRLARFATNRGVSHVRERHLDNIVKAFNVICPPDVSSGDSIKDYLMVTGLPDYFRQYYDLVVKTARRLHNLSSCVLISNDFYISFYSGDIQSAKDCFVREAKTVKDKADFDQQVSELWDKITIARGIPTAKDLDDIEITVLDVLSEVVKDPEVIWTDYGDHAYVTSFDMRPKLEQRFICFVTIEEGVLKTAYFKKPDFVQGSECYPIYTRPEGGLK